MKRYFLLFCVFFIGALTSLCAEVGQFMDFVPVADNGNIPDGTGYGFVKDAYSIGKYDVTVSQYCSFLNAVARKSDPFGLYDPRMSSDLKVASIERLGSKEEGYTYHVIGGAENFPITYVSWYSAARFCNWLEHKMPVLDEGLASTESGAYLLDGNKVVSINEKAIYLLPSESQWYKAAYYKGNGRFSGYWKYPTQASWEMPGNKTGDLANQMNYFYKKYCNDKEPYLTPVGSFTGSPGVYGTYDMGGNVFQWTSTPNASGAYIARGGSWDSHYDGFFSTLDSDSMVRRGYDPEQGSNTIGFRVACSAPKASRLIILDSDHQVHIELVTVGNPNNGSDIYGVGAVDVIYQIGKYSVTVNQYCIFLNTVATNDGFHDTLYSPKMAPFITCNRLDQSFTYEVVSGTGELPITYVDYVKAAYFSNWLENGQLRDFYAEMSLFYGSYTIDDSVRLNKDHAHWRLPDVNEWTKAGYYDAENRRYWKYPTQTDLPPGNTIGNMPHQLNYNRSFHLGDVEQDALYCLTPVGSFTRSLSPCGAYDMGGNVYELTGDLFRDPDTQNMVATLCGSSWHSPLSKIQRMPIPDRSPIDEGRADTGFRMLYYPGEVDFSSIKEPMPPSPWNDARTTSYAFMLQIGSQFLKSAPPQPSVVERAVSGSGEVRAGVSALAEGDTMRLVTEEVIAGSGVMFGEYCTLAVITSACAVPVGLASLGLAAWYLLPSDYGKPIYYTCEKAAFIDLGFSTLEKAGGIIRSGLGIASKGVVSLVSTAWRYFFV